SVDHTGLLGGAAPGRRPESSVKHLADAEEAVLDLFATFELVDDALHARVERDGIAAGSFAARDAGQGGEQADPVALQVEQRRAARTGRDVQTRLQQNRIVLHLRLPLLSLVRFAGPPT